MAKHNITIDVPATIAERLIDSNTQRAYLFLDFEAGIIRFERFHNNEHQRLRFNSLTEKRVEIPAVINDDELENFVNRLVPLVAAMRDKLSTLDQINRLLDDVRDLQSFDHYGYVTPEFWLGEVRDGILEELQTIDIETLAEHYVTAAAASNAFLFHEEVVQYFKEILEEEDED